MAGQTTYEYVVYLKDKMSGTMKKVGGMTSKEYDRMHKKQESLNASAGRLGRTIKRVFGFYIGVQGVKAVTNLASDMEETGSKFGVVYSGIQQEAEKTAATLKKSYGLSSLAAKQLLSDTGDLLTGFGFTQDMSLDLSNKVQKLAVDLASFTNYAGGATGASKALTKALLGERETVKELGIAILEEDVKAKVKAMEAAGKLEGMTMRQKKAYATMEIAMSQSKNALGDYARTSDSFANRLRKQKEWLKDLGASVGKFLLPAFSKLLKAGIQFTEWLNEHIKQVMAWIKWIGITGGSIWLVIKAVKTYRAIMAITAAVQLFFNKTVRKGNVGLYLFKKRMLGASASGATYSGAMGLAAAATKALSFAFRGLGKAIYSIPIIGWVAAGIALVIKLFKTLWDKSQKFREMLFGTWEVIKELFGGWFENIKFFVSKVGQMFVQLWEWIKWPFIKLWEALGSFGDTLKKNIWEPVKKVFTAIKNFIYDKLIKPIKELWQKLLGSKEVKRISDAYKRGAAKGAASFAEDQKKKQSKFGGSADEIKKMNSQIANAAAFGSGGTQGGLSDATSSVAKDIASGGRKQTNINISLEKFQDNVYISGESFNEAADQLEDKLTGALLRVLNSASAMASS